MGPEVLRSGSLADVVGHWAQTAPDATAYIDDAGRSSFSDYDASSDRLAALLVGAGLPVGARVAVLLPNGRSVHVAFLALEKAGLVAVGIGPRAGPAEIRHLLRVTGAVALLSRSRQGDLDLVALAAELRGEGLPLDHHFVVAGELSDPHPLLDPPPEAHAEEVRPRRLGPGDLFLLNSTSGTTGLPKCVRHDQRRWFFFHELALRTGRLSASDVFMSVVPAPFGFGIWTSHVTPTLLGAPVVVSGWVRRVSRRCDLLEKHRVTVMAAVSTQFILLLELPHRLEEVDLELRCAPSTRGARRCPTSGRQSSRRGRAQRCCSSMDPTRPAPLSGTSLDDHAGEDGCAPRVASFPRCRCGSSVRTGSRRHRELRSRASRACKGPGLEPWLLTRIADGERGR